MAEEMICGYCTHWQLIDMQQIADGVKKSQHIGRCRLHKVGRNRVSSCEQWEREPGADDDQQYAAYLEASHGSN